MRRTTALVGIGLLWPANILGQQRAEDGPFIDASGEAEIVARPDRATIFFDIEGHGTTVPEAGADLRAKIDSVQRVAVGLLGDEAVLMPWGYKAGANPQPPRMGDPRAPVRSNFDNLAVAGYQLDVPQIGVLQVLIDSLSVSGVRQILGIEYGHSDLAGMRERLTVLAVRDAFAQATSLAEGLDARVGDVVRIGPSTRFDPRSNELTQLTAYNTRLFTVPIRDISVRVRVQGRWRLIPDG